MTTNERLVALMIEAGYLDRSGSIGRKRFARAVSESPAARRVGRSYNHTYVGRWLNGVTPRDNDTRDAIREALGSRLGRLVASDELGFRVESRISPDVGLAYPDRPEDGITDVAELLEADLSGSAAVSESGVNVSA
ncbi:MAG: hypothetical protein ACRDRH_01205 [Pseudonocardia sp.]